MIHRFFDWLVGEDFGDVATAIFLVVSLFAIFLSACAFLLYLSGGGVC